MNKNSHGTKAIITALVGNFLIAIAKLTGYMFTMSYAMFSEAIHSFADCANQVLLLIGHKRALQKGNFKFNFGYGKEEFILSFMVAIVLFLFGSIVAIQKGIQHIIKPQQIHNVTWVIGILIFAIIIESYSLIQANKSKKTDEGFFKYLRNTSDSGTAVIIIEDTAALVGLAFTLIFITLAYTVNPIFDGIGALFTGLILGVLSIALGIELYKLLAGESLNATATYKLRQLITKNCKNIEQVNFIKSIIIGNDKYLIVVSIDPIDSDSAEDVQNLSQKIKKLVISKYPGSEIFVDFSKIDR